MPRRTFTEDDFLYPESGDLPEADSDLHRRTVAGLLARLEARYADATDVYVSGGIRVYCEEWNPYDVHIPDAFVAFGVPRADRTEYRGWAEPAMPAVVFEVTTAYTQQEDQHTKLRAYRDRWHVAEAFLFDPEGDYLRPRLQGFHRAGGKWGRINPAGGVLVSARLGLTLEADGVRLVLRDAATGALLLPEAEQRATAAEAEVARLRAELAALRKPKGR